ncbi:unnamed protein product [Rhodiola kirilowii]
MAHVLEHWFKQVPIVTRCYLTATVLTTIVCSLEIVTPLTLYLNLKLVFGDFQLRRLITNCLYLGNLDLNLLVRLYYMANYCQTLEEKAFRGRTADFFYMILFGATVMTGIVVVGSMIPYVSGSFVGIYFLSHSLIFMMVYVWSKYNPSMLISFFGLFNYSSAYLPWVLLGLSVLFGGNAWGNLLGMVAGHAFFFLDRLYPKMTGRRPLRMRTPSFIKTWFAEDAATQGSHQHLKEMSLSLMSNFGDEAC